MKNREAHALASLCAVQSFLVAHADRVPRAANSGARRRLDELIDQLLSANVDQDRGTWAALASTQNQLALRESLLYDHIAPVVALARFIAADVDGPPDLGVYRAPRGDPSLMRLYQFALGLAKSAEPWTDRFVAGGLRPTFLDDMRAAAEALLNAHTGHRQARGRVGGATIGLAHGVRIGRLAVRALATMVRSELRDDPALRQTWNMAVRIERLPRGTALALPAARAHTALPASESHLLLTAPDAVAE